MRRITSYLFSLFLLSCLAFVPDTKAQYVWHQILPTNIDTNHWYDYDAVGCNGQYCTILGQYVEIDDSINRVWTKMFRSTDAGLTWAVKDAGIPESHNQAQNVIHFVRQIDSLNIIAAGDTGLIIHTFDGGETWHRQDLPNPPVSPSNTFGYLGRVFDIHFSDAAVGIAVSEFPAHCYTTTDSGWHWNEISIPPSCYYPQGCYSYGNGMFRIASVIHGGTLFTTHDNWQTYDSSFISGMVDSAIDFNRVSFSGDTILAAGYQWLDSFKMQHLYIRRTVDGGTNWSLVPSVAGSFTEPYGLSSLDNDFVMMGGVPPGILLSTDRGETWAVDSIPFDTAGVGDPFGYRAFSIAVMGKGEAIMLSMAPPARLESAPSDYVNMQDKADPSLVAYPNPTSNIITIETINGNPSILDPLGRAYSVPRNGNTLDVSSLPAGIYYVVSNGANGAQQTAKFVKE